MNISGAPAWRQRVVAYGLLSTICCVLAVYLGKDLNWDQISYHYYAGFSAIHSRFDSDYFPASSQSYLYPYAYVPFYLLASSSLPDWIAATALALLGSVALWGAYEISARGAALIDGSERQNVVAGFIGALFALSAPVVFNQLGSSFIDLTTSGIVVGAFAILLSSEEGVRGAGRLLICGGLMGLATALKLTNALYAILGLFLVIALSPSVSDSAKRSIRYIASGMVVGGALYAPWGYKLFKEFGSPFFPLLNGVFKSPDFPVINSVHWRYVPLDILDWLLRPVRMLSPQGMVHTEPPAPDSRFAFLLLLLAVTLGMIIAAQTIGKPAALARSRIDSLSPFSRRWIASLLAMFATSWVIWLTLSGNSRYFMPMVVVAGPCLVILVWLVSASKRWRVYSLLAIGLLQSGIVVLGSVPRWHPTPYTGRWFDIEVPRQFKEEPGLFLSVDLQPAAFVVPYLHPLSGFVSVGGENTLGPRRPGWKQVERLIEKYESSLWLFAPTQSENPFSTITQLELDYRVARLGLEADPLSCKTIRLKGLWFQRQKVISIAKDRFDLELQISPHTDFLVCKLARSSSKREQYERDVSAADQAFALVEAHCPGVFAPSNSESEGFGKFFRRKYASSDSVLIFNSDQVSFLSVGMNEPQKLGNFGQIMAGEFQLDCARRRDPLLPL